MSVCCCPDILRADRNRHFKECPCRRDVDARSTAAIELKASFKSYLFWQPDGDVKTFLDWVSDELTP